MPTCPFCQEEIKAGAVVCPHCQTLLIAPGLTARLLTGIRQHPWRWSIGTAVAGVVMLLLVSGLMVAGEMAVVEETCGPDVSAEQERSFGAFVSDNQVGLFSCGSSVFSDCQLVVNPQLQSGYRHAGGQIRGREVTYIELAEFATVSGERFDPARHRARVLAGACLSASGDPVEFQLQFP